MAKRFGLPRLKRTIRFTVVLNKQELRLLHALQRKSDTTASELLRRLLIAACARNGILGKPLPRLVA